MHSSPKIYKIITVIIINDEWFHVQINLKKKISDKDYTWNDLWKYIIIGL